MRSSFARSHNYGKIFLSCNVGLGCICKQITSPGHGVLWRCPLGPRRFAVRCRVTAGPQVDESSEKREIWISSCLYSQAAESRKGGQRQRNVIGCRGAIHTRGGAQNADRIRCDYTDR